MMLAGGGTSPIHGPMPPGATGRGAGMRVGPAPPGPDIPGPAGAGAGGGGGTTALGLPETTAAPPAALQGFSDATGGAGGGFAMGGMSPLNPMLGRRATPALQGLREAGVRY